MDNYLECNERRAGGFSLIEILVAIALMAILTFAIAPQLKYMLNFESEQDTKNRLNELLAGLQSAYQVNSFSIEGDALAELNFGAAGITAKTTATAGQRCNSTATNFNPLAQYSGHAAASLVNDGYGVPLCILINPRASTQVDGITIYYHSIAFVSAGRNNVLDPGTALNPTTGDLTLGGDDVGVLFDGRKFGLDRYNATVLNMQKVASAYSQYYTARYQSDPSRSISTDYFALCGSSDAVCYPTYSSRWDASGLMSTTCSSGPVPMYTSGGTGPNAVLGLSQNDVTDGFGNIMTMDNCSNAVRSPNNTTGASYSIPPYTAAISTTIPGNQVITQTAVGSI